MSVLNKSLLGGALLAAVAIPGAVNSATESDTFDVRLTIQANCQITAADIDFGTFAVGTTAQYDGQGNVVVTCASGTTPYTVALSSGVANSYTPREMRQGSPLLAVQYNLFTTAARTTVWGDGSGATVTQASTAGQQQTFTAYGRVPAGQAVTPGVYLDTVTATVTF